MAELAVIYKTLTNRILSFEFIKGMAEEKKKKKGKKEGKKEGPKDAKKGGKKGGKKPKTDEKKE